MKTKLAMILMAVTALNLNLNAQPVMVKDIVPGAVSSYPIYLTNVNENLWFMVNNATLDTTYLYQSDGTAAGTAILIPLPQYSTNPVIKVFNNKILFTSSLFGSNSEPWISDGTSAGTFRLKDIYPGTGSSGATMIGSLGATAFLYGLNSNITNDLGIYKTDGTTIGTVLLFNISSFSKAIAFKNNMYFWGTYNSITGLWSFNANSTQPTMIAEHTNSVYNFALAVGSNLFYYVATDPVHGYEPWVSDGTSGGTKMLKDIRIGTGSSCDDGSSGSFSSMAILNDKLYFNPYESDYGRELWVSDGTTAGTNLFVDLTAGTGNGNPKNLVVAGDKLFFDVSMYLWVSDGTVTGTKIIKDVNSNSIKIAATKFPLNNKVFFSGTTNESSIGMEPYISDGTVSGSDILKDINPNMYVESISGNFQQTPVVIGNTIYFVANDGVSGNELWKYFDSGSGSTVPSAPGNLTATPTRSTSREIALSWQDKSNNETKFKIERSLNSSTGWNIIDSVTANVTSYADSIGLLDATAYYYRVNAYNLNGNSSYSNTANTTSLTGINDFGKANALITIYPNPANEELFIQSSEKIKTIKCTNYLGESLKLKIENNSMDMSGLAKGMYFIEITTESTVITKKFIKQ